MRGTSQSCILTLENKEYLFIDNVHNIHNVHNTLPPVEKKLLNSPGVSFFTYIIPTVESPPCSQI